MKNILIFILIVGFELSFNSSVAQSKYIKRVDKKLEKGDTAKAIKKLNRYIDRHSEMAELYLKRARIKLDNAELDPAMVDLNSYCSLNKECGQADLLKGMIQFKQGNYNAAIASLSRFTKENDEPSAWLYLGLSHMWLQNYPVAVNAFERSLKLNPSQPLALYNAGLASFYNDDFEQANELFEEAVILKPGDSDLIIARANALMKMRNYTESNELLRSISEDDKNFHKALFNIAVNYYSLEERDLACDYWIRAQKAGHMRAKDARTKYCGSKSEKVQKW